MPPSYFPEDARYETVVASLIYLMTQYSRTQCPRLARCIDGHMQWLALHPRADVIVRDMCASLRPVWQGTSATTSAGQRARLH